MTILVTGGAGFVGSHLVDRLIDLGHRVVIVDRQQSQRERFVPKEAIVFTQEMGDPTLEAIFAQEKPEVVFHLAAQISVTRSVEDPAFDAQQNIVDSVRLLDLSAQYGVHRFIFASSGGAIYGDHPIRPTPEDVEAEPLSPYGIAKQSTELYLQHFAQQRGLSTLALRFSNIYGPRQQMVGGYAGVMPIFLSRLVSQEPVTIFGEGHSTRDYVFVDDVVDAFIAAMASAETGVINIATGKETTVLELWEALKALHSSDAQVTHEPARPGEVERSHLSPERAWQRLGWKAKTDIKEGLKKTYDWFIGR